MASGNKAIIFISYARRDGAELAARLHDDLCKRDFDVWVDTDRLEGGSTWTKKIEEALDRSEIILALLTPGSYVSEVCRAEQLRGLRKGKCVIPVLGIEGSDVPLHLEAKNYRTLAGTGYAFGLTQLLRDIAARRGVQIKEKYRNTYVTAPPMPQNYVERPIELAALRNRIVADGRETSVALTALEGMGGIGKTVLAQALCRDEVIQEAFPDGIVWTTAGKEATFDLITRVQEVRRALGDEPSHKESELECINRYRTVLQNKAALVIVDDVWRAGDIEPFRADSARSRLLFTTRDAGLAAEMGAQEQVADLLSPVHARDLFVRWSGVKALPPVAEDLIGECGGLPLAISMIGAILRGKPLSYWEHVYNLVRSGDPTKLGRILRATQVSVEALPPVERERYLALAVLLEDMPAHPIIQQSLWDVDRFEALETAERFVSLSLAERDGDSGGIRLHDLQLDYVRAQFSDTEALELIHGALMLSSHIIARDPSQFASQMCARLMAHGKQPTISGFAASLSQGSRTPWIRSLRPTLDPPGSGLLRTLIGHINHVYCVATSLDGRRAVSGSQDCTVKVWEVDTGQVLRTFRGHSGPVHGVAMSTDGRMAVSASRDRTLKVWSVETGYEIRTLTGHSGDVYAVAIYADGTRALSASEDGTLKIWDLDTGHELRTLIGHSSSVSGVAVAEDGRKAISASQDYTLKVWDLETGRELQTLLGHTQSVHGVGMTSDGRLAVSASRDYTLKVWNLETGGELRTLVGHAADVWGVAVRADGRRAVSASQDHTLKVWDLQSGRELCTLAGHSYDVRGVVVNWEKELAISASGDKTLKVWALEKTPHVRPLAAHSKAIFGLAVSRDSRHAISASLDGVLKLWDLDSNGGPRSLAGHAIAIYSVAVSENGRVAVSASLDGTLKVWDLETEAELRTIAVSHSVVAVAMSADGRRAITASRDRALSVWDLETGRKLRTLGGHSNDIYGVAMSADGLGAVSASWDKTLKVWDLQTGREVRTLVGHGHYVWGVAMTGDGRVAVSASGDRTLRVWDLASGQCLRTLTGHFDSVWAVALSADERLAVSASEDKSLKLWDLETGCLIATFSCDAATRCCAFAGNRKIIAGDHAGRIHSLSIELPSDELIMRKSAFERWPTYFHSRRCQPPTS